MAGHAKHASYHLSRHCLWNAFDPQIDWSGGNADVKPACRILGGALQVLRLSFLLEICISVVLAPILMVQQSMAVVKTVLGFDAGWKPQNRNGDLIPPLQLLRFHAVETIIGAALTAGPFSLEQSLSGSCQLPQACCSLSQFRYGFSIQLNHMFSLLGSFEDFNEPEVAQRSRLNQEQIESQLA